ncbi:MAG: VCBS repeat-containing protein [Chloracidobacterium sp.]|nr:VCBS repeat-containing protein [Chloracidobacterium sp.]
MSITPAGAATRTWTGAGSDNRFSTAANWAENAPAAISDDLIFPASSQQFTGFNDLPMTSMDFFHSMTFQGGNYAISGNGGTLSITANSGTQQFSNLWRISGTIFAGTGSSVTITVFSPSANVTIDGPGSVGLTLNGSFGGVIVKNGPGNSSLFFGSPVASLTVNGGQLLISSPLINASGPFTINGGTLAGFNIATSALKVTGANSEFAGSVIFAGALEVSKSGRLSVTTCNLAVAVVNPPILTQAQLTLNFGACTSDPFSPMISVAGIAQIAGSFTDYPEGTFLMVGGRQFRFTYRGGDGNDVQLVAVSPTSADFDGDGRADISTFRPSEGNWYVQGQSVRQWGVASDTLVPADYDGDRKTDYAVYRSSDGRWYIFNSANSTMRVNVFGLSEDVPTPLDIDGDAKADIAIFRPSTGDWWYARSRFADVGRVHFGQTDDMPATGDYDGDGRSDIAVFRPSTGSWFVRRTSTGAASGYKWGEAGDKLVPADYDGDGRTDLAVYRPSQGVWYVLTSGTPGFYMFVWGSVTDLPVPADYDGDGRADIGIFRPSDGNWWIMRSSAGVMVQQFGLSDDKPIPAAFIY